MSTALTSPTMWRFGMTPICRCVQKLIGVPTGMSLYGGEQTIRFAQSRSYKSTRPAHIQWFDASGATGLGRYSCLIRSDGGKPVGAGSWKDILPVHIDEVEWESIKHPDAVSREDWGEFGGEL